MPNIQTIIQSAMSVIAHKESSKELCIAILIAILEGSCLKIQTILAATLRCPITFPASYLP